MQNLDQACHVCYNIILLFSCFEVLCSCIKEKCTEQAQGKVLYTLCTVIFFEPCPYTLVCCSKSELVTSKRESDV